MKKLLAALRWDFIRQWRYNIIGIMLVVTALYIGILYFLPLENKNPLLVFLIFNDPTALGMIFIGSLILFEKSDGTLQALSVSPLKKWQYLLSKAISLTVIATGSSVLIALLSHDWPIQLHWLIIGVVLSSLLFVFLGVLVVAACQSFNQYLLRLVIYFIPLSLPLLNFVGITDTYLWYVFPTQGTLFLLEATFDKLPFWKIAYAIMVLLVWTIGVFLVALKIFRKGLYR